MIVFAGRLAYIQNDDFVQVPPHEILKSGMFALWSRSDQFSVANTKLERNEAVLLHETFRDPSLGALENTLCSPSGLLDLDFFDSSVNTGGGVNDVLPLWNIPSLQHSVNWERLLIVHPRTAVNDQEFQTTGHLASNHQKCRASGCPKLHLEAHCMLQ